MPFMSSLELKVPPAAVVLLTGAGMWLASAALPSLAFSFSGWQAVAVVLAVAGGIVAVLGVASFRRARTTVNPLQPQGASSLVTTGIYRFSRNPMYLGMLFLLAGLAVFLANAAALIFLPVFVVYMNRFQIQPEERALSAIFGSEFTAYRQKVRRWI
jgi:protein-S-isoprenylcysteine O-methyltransferase Ste14